MLVAAIEGGGSAFRWAVEDVASEKRVAEGQLPTSDPERTVSQLVERLAGHRPGALGLATFGPIELDPAAASYGTILSTPKEDWTGFPLRARLSEALAVPVTVDTDVNAAALAEQRRGAAQGADPTVYVTVGTGVGMGAVVNGRPLHGLLHPELGHLLVPRLPLVDGSPDPFMGVCPFHGRCLEGVASAPALAARFGRPPEDVRDGDPVWDLTARYLAHGLAAVVLSLAPKRIVLGGGVLSRPGLRHRVADALTDSLAGYLPRRELGVEIDAYLVAPAFAHSGLEGAFDLARDAATRRGRVVARPDPV
jgi:fructokinase